MSVVVTPDSRSPVLSSLDVSATEHDPAESVATWRDAGADAVVVDSVDEWVVDVIRAAAESCFVPVLVVTTDERPSGAADATLHPEADAADARAAVEQAVAARDYRRVVAALYEACRGRGAGQPDQQLRDLRAEADRAFEALDEVPPSAFDLSTTSEQ